SPGPPGPPCAATAPASPGEAAVIPPRCRRLFPRRAAGAGMASVSTSVPAAVVLKAVRGWRLFPCRAEIDQAVMAAHPSQPAGSTGCRWLLLAAEMAGLAGGSWRSPPDPDRTGWARPPRIATRALSAQAGSVRAARDFTVATLRRWGTAHSSQDIAIVVSEMVTNALRHALPGPGDTGPRGPV